MYFIEDDFKLLWDRQNKILKDKNNTDYVIAKIRDWRRWMSIQWQEVNILKKADKQIQKVCDEAIKHLT